MSKLKSILVPVCCAAFAACIGVEATGPEKWALEKDHVVWQGSGKRMVAYFTNWAQYRAKCKFEVRHIDASMFTNIIYGFAKIDAVGGREHPEFRLAPFEANDMGSDG